MELLRASDISDLKVDPKLILDVHRLMTPCDMLAQIDFAQAMAIAPYQYFSFTDLLADRELIRNLRLLPVKSSADRAFYHAQPKDELFRRVLGYLGDSDIALAKNAFPDMLPEDVGQYLVWVRDQQIREVEVLQFIAGCMQKLELTSEDLILFERSRNTNVPLVRGTFAEMRHIHFWTRLKK